MLVAFAVKINNSCFIHIRIENDCNEKVALKPGRISNMLIIQEILFPLFLTLLYA